MAPRIAVALCRPPPGAARPLGSSLAAVTHEVGRRYACPEPGPSGWTDGRGGSPQKRRSVEARDLGTAHDGVLAPRHTNPRLVAAVVVGRPQDELRLLAFVAADATAAAGLRVEAGPEANERVRVPLLPHRGRPAVPGMAARLVRQRHELVHDRPPQVLEARRAGRPGSADGALEEHVRREDIALA